MDNLRQMGDFGVIVFMITLFYSGLILGLIFKMLLWVYKKISINLRINKI